MRVSPGICFPSFMYPAAPKTRRGRCAELLRSELPEGGVRHSFGFTLRMMLADLSIFGQTAKGSVWSDPIDPVTAGAENFRGLFRHITNF
jgi:hypothetical protein